MTIEARAIATEIVDRWSRGEGPLHEAITAAILSAESRARRETLEACREWVESNVAVGPAYQMEKALSTSPSPTPQQDAVRHIVIHVVAYDESGYGDNRSRDFGDGDGDEAVKYAQSLEPRFGATVWKTVTFDKITTKIWPAEALARLSHPIPERGDGC